jgi:hypothetical protein
VTLEKRVQLRRLLIDIFMNSELSGALGRYTSKILPGEDTEYRISVREEFREYNDGFEGMA